MEKLRVAAVIGKMIDGGVESIVFSLARVLQKAGSPIAFDFYYDDDSTRKPPEDLIGGGARFFCVPRYQKPFAYLKTMVPALKKGGYAIVHSHINTMSFLPLFAAKLAGVPVRVVHNHSTAHEGEGMKTVLKNLLRLPARWWATDRFACGEKAAVWMYGEKALTDGSVTVLLNGVEPDAYRFDPATRSNVRKELGIPEDAFVIGHLGRFVYQKNHARLLSIFKAVLKEEPKAYLVLIGGGELRDEIAGLAAETGVSERVVFAGVRHDAGRLYSAFDSFILPSFYEGLPVVGIEAQFNGVPCVFSSGITGEVFVNENVTALSLEEPDAVFARAALNGRRCAPSPDMEKFDIRASAKKLERFYLEKVGR